MPFQREQVCPLLRTGMTQTAGGCCVIGNRARESRVPDMVLASLLTHMPLRVRGAFAATLTAWPANTRALRVRG